MTRARKVSGSCFNSCLSAGGTMIRTNRMWLAVIAIAGALIGTGCPGRGKPRTGEPDGKPEAGAPQKPPCPDSPKAGRICNSPYAIVETDAANCEAELRGGWKLYPRRQYRRDGARSDNKQPSIGPTPRGAARPAANLSASMNGKATDRPTPDDFCADSWDAGVCDRRGRHRGPRRGGRPLGETGTTADHAATAAAERPFFRPKVRTSGEGVRLHRHGAGETRQERTRGRRGRRFALGRDEEDASGHGYAMSRIIGHLSCVGGADAPDCKDFVLPYVALPLVYSRRTETWSRARTGASSDTFTTSSTRSSKRSMSGRKTAISS